MSSYSLVQYNLVAPHPNLAQFLGRVQEFRTKKQKSNYQPWEYTLRWHYTWHFHPCHLQTPVTHTPAVHSQVCVETLFVLACECDMRVMCLLLPLPLYFCIECITSCFTLSAIQHLLPPTPACNITCRRSG